MITTYPEMNETVKNLLRMSGDPTSLYVLARIEELEAENKQIVSDRLRELDEADKDGRVVVLPKESHQPCFVKDDATNMLDQWNDVTGAVPKGTGWYYELQSVVESVAAMAFGAGVFYESERKGAHNAE